VGGSNEKTGLEVLLNPWNRFKKKAPTDGKAAFVY
jgi:hypothetical protein